MNKDTDLPQDPPPAPELELSTLARAQRSDPTLLEIIEYKVDHKLPNNKTLARNISRHAHQYLVDSEGVLRKIDERHHDGRPPRAVLPRHLWDDIIQAYHDPPHHGHCKFKNLLDAISATYYFPGMSVYIKVFLDRYSIY